MHEAKQATMALVTAATEDHDMVVDLSMDLVIEMIASEADTSVVVARLAGIMGGLAVMAARLLAEYPEPERLAAELGLNLATR